MRRTIITVASSALLFAGCASTPEEPRTGAKAQEPSTTGEASRTQSQPFERKAMAGTDLNAGKSDPAGMKGAHGVPSQRSIYYDYDKFELKDEYRRIVEAHAKYLRENPGAKVMIQGNADERGSREYNMGLAERRGNAVSSAIQANGGSGGQMEVVSYGEERPVCTESNEACWSQNRRAEFEITAGGPMLRRGM